MKRLSLALCLLLSLGLCACAPKAAEPSPEPTPTPLLLGFSQLGAESAWRLGNTASVQAAAKSHGVNLMYENANQKQSNQIDAIRSFIAYRVDVIAFSPIVEDGWDNVLTEAREAGVPVILSDRMIRTDDPTLYAGYVGADFYDEGLKAGQFLLRKADDMGRDVVRVAEITGTLDSTPMRQRYQGFRDALAGDPRFRIVASVTGDFLRSKGRECMESLLDELGGDGIDVLYSHNDGMTLGAIEAMEARGIQPGSDIVIVTVDGEQAAIDLLKAGRVNCVVECTPMLGDLLMELAAKLVSEGEIPRETHPEERVFTEYDDLSALAPRGY